MEEQKPELINLDVEISSDETTRMSTKKEWPHSEMDESESLAWSGKLLALNASLVQVSRRGV